MQILTSEKGEIRMKDHSHIWIKWNEWTERDKCGRIQHYTAFKCKDPLCTIEKVILEETTTFEYKIDRSEDWSDED